MKGRLPPFTYSAVVSALAEIGAYPPIRTTPADDTQLVCSYLPSVRLAYFGHTVDKESNEAGENSKQKRVGEPPHIRVCFWKVFMVCVWTVVGRA